MNNYVLGAHHSDSGMKHLFYPVLTSQAICITSWQGICLYSSNVFKTWNEAGFFACLVWFWEAGVSLGSLGSTGTLFVDQAELELRDLPTSDS